MTTEALLPTRSIHDWRRYNAQTPTKPELLTRARYDALMPHARDAYDEERFDFHSTTTIISTPLIQYLTKEARLLLIVNRRQVGARQGIILSGPPTTGKTTALIALGASVENLARRRRPEHKDAPVVFVSLPPQATPKNIARSIVAFFGIHPPARTTFHELSTVAVGHLSDFNTQLLIIDEIHNMSLRHRAGAVASDFLKHLAEQVNTTMVYAGVEVESAGLFEGIRGRQLAGRFTLVPAQPFSYATEQDRQVWTILVGAFEANLRLVDHRPATLARLSRYLYTRTGGHIGSLSHLISKAAISAILDGHERIDRSLLETIRIDIAAHNAEARSTANPKVRPHHSAASGTSARYETG